MAFVQPPAGPAATGTTPDPRIKNANRIFDRLVDHLRRSAADGSLFFGIALIAVFMLSRPFEGIEGDARIYMARALADLSPAGVGRDLMFVHDGQSQFSMFRFIADRLVAALNPSYAALVFALSGFICWLAAAQYFVSRFAAGRMKWAILMIVAVVPCFYGPFQLLRFAEQYATPRPFAEACVLAALACLIDRRRVPCLIFLTVGAALHPIMALPGVLIFAIDLVRSDRRWISLGVALGIIVAIAAACGLPLFDRLTVLIDADWLGLLRDADPYLFPSLWPFETFGFFGLQLATILLACELLAPRARFIFWSAAGVGIGGVVLAAAFGDFWPILLVVQMQLWRTIWLTSVIAAMSLGLCLLNLPRRPPRFELASASLVLGWLFYDEPVFALSAAAAAVLLYSLRSLSFSIGRPALNMVWALVLVTGVIAKLPPLLGFLKYMADKPQDYHAGFSLLWNIYLLSIPIAAFAVGWALRPHWISTKFAGAFATVLALAVVFLWDDRQPSRKITDIGLHPAELVAHFPAVPSEIYWMNGREPWYLLGHPTWALRIQGAGIVFSRPLAMIWRDRIKALAALNLTDGNELAPWTIPGQDAGVELTRDAVDRLCARPDAPSTIVAPLEEGMSNPTGLKFEIWKPPVAQFRLTQNHEAVIWHRIDKFVIVSCADRASEQNTFTK